MVGLFGQFGQKIADWLGHGASAASSPLRIAEKRQWPRFAARKSTSCEAAVGPDCEKLSATMMDISQGGIRLTVSRRYASGSLLHVAVPHNDLANPPALLACVIHVEGQREGSWLMGCSFIRELSSAEMGAFLSSGKSL